MINYTADQAGGLVRVEGGDGVHVMFLQRLQSLLILLLAAAGGGGRVAQGPQGGLEANTWYVWTVVIVVTITSHQHIQVKKYELKC